MTQEDKMLLIKDLSSRLPYAVHVQHISGVSCILHDISISIYHKYDKNDNIYDTICYIDLFRDGGSIAIEQFKPYLFPLSSMTEEQAKEIQEIVGNPDYACIIRKTNGLELWLDSTDTDPTIWLDTIFEVQDYLNKNLFDYRNLINKNLAIDCTNLNIY